jgi:hypothetical protein
MVSRSGPQTEAFRNPMRLAIWLTKREGAGASHARKCGLNTKSSHCFRSGAPTVQASCQLAPPFVSQQYGDILHGRINSRQEARSARNNRTERVRSHGGKQSKSNQHQQRGANELGRFHNDRICCAFCSRRSRPRIQQAHRIRAILTYQASNWMRRCTAFNRNQYDGVWRS